MGKHKKMRQTNMEMLRIIAMIMIIVLHFLGFGEILKNVSVFSKNYFIYWFIEGISFVAVNMYVLISGYFLVDSKFSIKKLFTLIAEVLFYSIVIYAIFVFTGLVDFSAKDLVKVLIPTLSGKYWFFTMYIGMYILSPFLNLAIKAMSKKQLLSAVIVLIALFSIWPNLVFFSTGLNFGGGQGVVWFVVLYFIAAYIKIAYKPTFHTKKLTLFYIIAASLVPLSRFILALMSKTPLTKWISSETLIGNSGVFYTYNSILVLLASIALFILFLNINIKNTVINKIVLFFAPLTFGVYLIHENNFMRTFLWDLVGASDHLSKGYFPFFMIAVVLIIFISCSLIEFLRSWLFKKILSGQWFDRFCNGIENTFRRFLNRFAHPDQHPS